jgi:glucokinase
VSYTLGIDIGGTKIAAGVVAEDGEILVQDRRATPARNARAVIEAIGDLAAQFRDHDPTAIGIGVAGLVDAARSRVMMAPNLAWQDEALRDAVEEATRLPTVVENDANAAAWGEYRFGAGRGVTDLVTVTVGTGIGGGIVSGGELQRGAHGMAAEFGHIRVVADGRLCGCGRRGCWEQYASGNALVRITREFAVERRAEAGLLLSLGDGTPEGISGRDITEAARQGDPVAVAAFETVGTWLAVGMVDVAALLDPAVFVIGGGVVDAGDLLLGPARRIFAQDVVGKDFRELPPILPAALGNHAGISGAGDLARHR